MWVFPDINLKTELKKTIPWKLVVIFMLFTFGIIVIGFEYYKAQRNRIFTENQNNLTAIAKLKIEQIEQWHSERLGDAEVIKNNGPLVNSLKQYFLNSNLKQVRKELTDWMQSVYQNYDYSGISVIDMHHVVRLSFSPIDSVRTSNMPTEFSDVMKKHIVIMTDLHRSDKSDAFHIDLLIPLIEPLSVDQKPFGILILRINPEKVLFPLIQSWPIPSKSSETLILRKDGDSIIYINELRHLKNSALNLKLPISNKALLAAKAVNDETGVTEGIDYRNIPVIGYLSGISGFPWYMVAKIDKKEVEAPLKRQFLIAIFGTIMLVLINASVFGLWIWDQRIRSYRDQIKNETAISESEEKFNTAFMMSPVSITISLIADNRFIDVNNNFLNDIEYSRDEVIGKTARELDIWADESERLWLINEIRERGKVFGKVLTYKSKTGKIIYGLSSISVVNVNGQPCNLSTVVNVTEGIKANAEIRLQSEIMSHMAEAVYLVRLQDGIIVFANSRFEDMFGYESGEMFGRHVSLVNAPTEKSPEETASEIIRSLTENGLWQGEVLNIKKDGTNFWTQANVTLFDHSQFGKVLISVQKDITEHKTAEAEIRILNEELEEKVIQRTAQFEAANKELEAFSYSVSHDLRAPLRSVHGYTKILLEEYQNVLDDEGKRLCGIISSSATQMGELIDDLLSFSRLGRSTLDPSMLDMKGMAKLKFETLTSIAEREKIKIKIGRLEDSYGDSSMIDLVWNNLISNAIKYSAKNEKPEISIGSEVIGDKVIYSVKDNGVGFDMLYKSKLFGVFQRLHSGKEFEGNGVGLALVQRIINKHKGEVWAEGEVGKGATFYFSLPVSDKRLLTSPSSGSQ